MNFLLEIGTEEIPDWMIPGALESLQSLFVTALERYSLGEGVTTRMDATPRRLVLRAMGIPERQRDKTEQLLAPAKSAEGLERKHGESLRFLRTQALPKGEYRLYEHRIAGRDTKSILAAELPAIIPKIQFPKTMYWTGKSGPRFIRPIRWVVCLLESEVIPFDLGGVRSGNVSAGHRVLGAARVPVTIENYERQLRDNGVILSAAEREQRIRAAVDHPDQDLLKTLVYLTEFPAVISGRFDEEFLELPEEVLVTVMRHHQRYFAVRKNGRLANCFLAVMNTDSDPDGLVRRGNERVLRARFKDARFFWRTDQRKPLADRVADLANVTFQAKLGSYLEKTGRIASLVEQLGGDEHGVRAARLCKADLTTELVREFTELQGIVGGLYAREQGEPEPVWQGIYDHYKPAGMEDTIPRNPAGRLVSIADKLDTLRGCFRAGMIPSGSRDPFALRRAAQGIVKVLVEGKLPLPLRDLLEGNAQLEEFVLDRVRYYFRDIRGFRYDEVNAVLASGWNDLADVDARLEAIRAVRPTENFEPLAASFKRIQNILRQAGFSGDGGNIDPQLLEPGPEADLYREFERVRDLAGSQPYEPALASIASLRPRVDLFFDKVLVNAPDPDIRRNRLTLLHRLLAEFSTIADFSEIVTN